MTITDNPFAIKIRLIQLGVSQLHNLGYWWANVSNITSDAQLCSYFRITLIDQLGWDAETDEVIYEMLEEF